MKKVFSWFFVMSVIMIILAFPTKTNAAEFDGITEEKGSTHVVAYGKKIGVKLETGETITSDNTKICKIDSGGKLQIVGVGEFSLTSKKGDNEDKIKFFAWNVCLKKDGYTVYSDSSRTKALGDVFGKTYFAVSKTSDKKTFKIIEHLYITGKCTASSLDGLYLTSYYNEVSTGSDVNNFEYSLLNRFDNDDDGSQGGSSGGQGGQDEDFDLKIKLGTTLTPEGGAGLTWTVENEDILELEDASTGRVRGIRVGITRIIGKSGGTKKYDKKIKVYRVNGQIINVSKIVLDKTKAEIKKDETLKLEATIIPSYADNRKITWETSNPTVASVSTRGRVTPKSDGQVTITASTINGASAKCEVTVKTKLTGKELGQIFADAAKIMYDHKGSFGYNVNYGSAATSKKYEYWMNSRHVRTSSSKQYKYWMNCEGFCKTVIRWTTGLSRSDVCETLRATGSTINAPSIKMTINGKQYSGGKITDDVITRLLPGDILIWRGRSHLGMYVGEKRVIEISDTGVRNVPVTWYNGSRVLGYVWRPSDELAAKIDESKIDKTLKKVNW